MTFPSFFSRLAVGGTETFSNDTGEISILKYVDKKDVHVLTTAHECEVVEVKGKPKPLAVVKYNKSMGGVDFADKVSVHE